MVVKATEPQTEEREVILAFIGDYTPLERRAVKALTGLKQGRIKRYQSFNQLVAADRTRPDFDLIVFFGVREIEFLMNSKQLVGPKAIMCLDINAHVDSVRIDEKGIASVQLKKASNPADFARKFTDASLHRWAFWPKHLAKPRE